MDDRRPTRRALLAAGAATAAAAVAGCGSSAAPAAAHAAGTTSAPGSPTSSPAVAAATSGAAAATTPAAAPPAAWAIAVAAGESNLLASYDAVTKAHPAVKKTLAPLRAAHAAHLKALKVHPPGKALAGLPSGQAEALSRLAGAEQKASDTVAAVGVTCPVEAAALLGSIAAADASHVLVLHSAGSA